jgi:protein N-terminal methyltransferase
LNQNDARDSLAFLREVVIGKYGANKSLLIPPRIGKVCACDCGAGIGRVSQTVLLKLFDKVDLVESDAKFLEKSREFLGEDAKRVGEYINLGLQEFSPEKGRYDLIWCQWVLSHLTDDDLVEFLRRCKDSMGTRGLIGVKENCARFGREYDDEDSSVTRPEAEFEALFARAGLKVIKKARQTDFPDGLYPVEMWLLSN